MKRRRKTKKEKEEGKSSNSQSCVKYNEKRSRIRERKDRTERGGNGSFLTVLSNFLDFSPTEGNFATLVCYYLCVPRKSDSHGKDNKGSNFDANSSRLFKKLVLGAWYSEHDRK